MECKSSAVEQEDTKNGNGRQGNRHCDGILGKDR